MKTRHWFAFPLSLVCLVCIASIGGTVVQTQSVQTTPAQNSVPDIAGAWAGTWGAYNPSQGSTPPKSTCKDLTAKVERKEDLWQATFEGDCGRPYKYSIKMEGRQAGKVVMFKGTTDLGAKDGGVFDWIGRATEKEFIGFFTSAYYTGTFSLTRAQ